MGDSAGGSPTRTGRGRPSPLPAAAEDNTVDGATFAAGSNPSSPRRAAAGGGAGDEEDNVMELSFSPRPAASLKSPVPAATEDDEEEGGATSDVSSGAGDEAGPSGGGATERAVEYVLDEDALADAPGSADAEGEDGGEEGEGGEEGWAGVTAEDVERLREYVAGINADPDISMTIEHALWIFMKLAELPEEHHIELLELGAARAIFVLIRRALISPEALEWALTAMWRLAFLPEGEALLVEQNAIEEVVGVMELGDSVSLHRQGFGCLAALSCSPQSQAKMLELRVHELALETLLVLDGADPEICHWCFTLLAFLADESPENRTLLLAAKTLDTVLRTLRATVLEDDLGSCVATATGLLVCTRLLEDEAARADFFAAKGHLTTIECMTHFPHHLEVQLNGCHVLSLLAAGSSADNVKTERNVLRAAEAPAALHQAMASQPGSAALHSKARLALRLLAEGYVGYAFQSMRWLYNALLE